MSNALTKTNFNFPGQKSVYHGKVRDVYNINDDFLVMVVSDRISAFERGPSKRYSLQRQV
jgi:phosphoribosylaminoimidazole-succinocarboxamide synthase